MATDSDTSVSTATGPQWILQGVLPIDPARVPADVVAGVTLAALAIPEVMGYATLAGMPVITGLYTILLPMLVFGVLGSSRHLVVGADSATAVVMTAGLAGLAATGSDQYVALAGLLALIVAVFLILARLARVGFLADFLSRTVLVGFLTGVGIQVAAGQVGGMLGISSGDGITIGGITFTSTIATLVSTLGNIGDISWTTAAVSAGVLVTILGLKLITDRIPGALIAVVGAIVVSWGWDLADRGVSTLGPLPSGLPNIGLPDVDMADVPALIATAFSIFVLVLAQSAATSRAYAAKYDEHFDENVDLIGLGAANAAAGLSGTFVVNGSPTKTQMVDGAGGRSQLAQMTTGVIVVIVLLFLTAPISYMPDAVLASVVFLIGVELVDVDGMRRILRLALDEFVVATLVAVTVIVLGVEQGIVLAIVAAAIDHLRHSYRPATAVLQRAPDGDYHGVDTTPTVRSLPGLVVYRFAGPLYYANASIFLAQTTAFAGSTDPPRWLCLYAGALPYIDYSGAETIRQLHGELDEQGIRLVVAEPMHDVRRQLDRYGLTDLLGADGIYPTVNAVVRAFEQQQG
jgi:SulP family sulfate permease